MSANERLTEGVVEHGEQIVVGHIRAWTRSDHVVRPIAAAGDDSVLVIESVAGFDRQDWKDNLSAVELGQALRS